MRKYTYINRLLEQDDELTMDLDIPASADSSPEYPSVPLTATDQAVLCAIKVFQDAPGQAAELIKRSPNAQYSIGSLMSLGYVAAEHHLFYLTDAGEAALEAQGLVVDDKVTPAGKQLVQHTML